MIGCQGVPGQCTSSVSTLPPTLPSFQPPPAFLPPSQVGIHERSAREKISHVMNANGQAHIMNDEATRKYFQVRGGGCQPSFVCESRTSCVDWGIEGEHEGKGGTRHAHGGG